MPNCGIVDVGSNTIRLSIYQYNDLDFKLLLGKKETAGLAGYVENGRLAPEGIEIAARVLTDFRTLLDNLEIDQLHVFATASLRNISNTDEAVDAIQAAAGVPIQVITGSEEAALSFQGALHGTPKPEGQGLLADIGGGSTELVIYPLRGQPSYRVAVAVYPVCLRTFSLRNRSQGNPPPCKGSLEKGRGSPLFPSSGCGRNDSGCR